MDAEAQHCSIPKLTLQPLVENAVIHGIREKESRRGSILVSARLIGQDVELAVWDDGVGMDGAAIAAALSAGRSRGAGGFGASNINERLQLLYGSGYGLSYESTPGEGTRAIVRIPQRADEQPQA